MRIGSEFFHICQEQVHLLTRGLGASLAIVALLERPAPHQEEESMVFLPVLTYPDALDNVDPHALKLWLINLWLAEQNKPSSVQYANMASPMPREANFSPDSNTQVENNGELTLNDQAFPQSELSATNPNPAVVTITDGALGPRMPLVTSKQNQIVMPLIYQDVMVGLLVTARGDRGWHPSEKYDVERMGQTLAAAYVLEQRSQWLEQRLHQQSKAYAQIQAQQQDVVDDVLHQFRNPLTALRTFGKLLLKRLQPSDRNRAVAESIVRESDRLQELLKQLSAAAELPSLALPSAQSPTPTASAHTTILIPGSSESSLSDSGQAEENRAGARGDAVNIFQGDASSVVVDDGSRNDDVYDKQAVAGPEPGDPLNPVDTVRALTGKEIQRKPYDPMEFLEPLLVSAHAIAQDRQLELCVTCSEPYKPILADVKALREVCSNLIDNALKYTPPPGRVDIVVGIERNLSVLKLTEQAMDSDDRSMQGIAIADTGPGIPAADQERLFERHFRGVQRQGDIPGTGLGLAIAKLLMQQMGGAIQVFSPISACPFDELQAVLPQAQQAPGTMFIIWLLTP
ncbi:MAG: sensor histidine kinase [Cyanobacteria bacterium P01_F01_bin.150]